MIPKKVHLSWKTKDLLDSKSPLVVHGVKRLVDLNPDWEVTIYDDQEVDDYLKTQLEPQVYALIASKHIVQKTDLWRLIKLYEEGGLYIDVDRFVDTPLNDLVDENTKWVLPTHRDYDFSHDFMMTAPHNPAYGLAAQMYIERMSQGHTNVYFLGPQTYMHAVTQTLTGEILNTDLGIAAFDRLRDIMKSCGFIKTFREEPPYNTIVYRGENLGLDWEQEKRKFYAESGLKHWSGDW
jgi:mannosyltransferase OCH1-like enzyme